MTLFFRAGIKRSRTRGWVAIAVSLALHVAAGAPPGFEPPGQFRRRAVTPLMVTLEPAIVAAQAPSMPEAGGSVPKRATPPSTIAPTVRTAAAVEEMPRGQSVPAETSHSGLDAPPAPRPSTVYYTVHELDIYPTLRQPLNIDWKSRPEPGWLTVGLTLDETGVVEDAAMVGASPDREAEAALLAALRRARFTAALKEGRAVRSRIFLRFRLGAETLARRP